MQNGIYSLLTVVVLTISAFGQTSRGAVTGTVLDPSGASMEPQARRRAWAFEGFCSQPTNNTSRAGRTNTRYNPRMAEERSREPDELRESFDHLHRVIVDAAKGKATREDLEKALADANAVSASRMLMQSMPGDPQS